MVPVSNANATGTVTFSKRANATRVIIRINGVKAGESYPAHIHRNTAAEGGDIAIDLNSVDGNTGISTTDITVQKDGTPVSYEQLLEYNGYVNVHKSPSELTTIVSQADIGKNALTETSKVYTLDSLGATGAKGTATFTKRADGTALVALKLNGTTAGNSHPAHIHVNTAAEGGAIAISLAPVDGATGLSATSVKKLDNGTAITYDQLLDFDGYVNVHQSAANLAEIISQGDIGGNEVVATNQTYNLEGKALPGVSGTARFDKRKNGNTLVTLTLEDLTPNGMHPAHIHFNSAVEGGGIAISLNPVNSNTGISKTTVRKTDGANGMAVKYDSLVNFDGYINVHASAADLATIIAQGDIGANELTGNRKDYVLSSLAVPGATGTARFAERKDGSTLVTLKVPVPAGGPYPAHIHANAAAEGGGIDISLNDVLGSTGMSMTQVEKKDDGTAVKYADLLKYNGYVNVHQSAANLATLVAQGDIGGNELTGVSKTYVLLEKGGSGVYGTAKFEERANGNTLVTLTMANTIAGATHPAHIHKNTAAAGGPIAIDLKSVNGTTGKSLTTVSKLNDGKAIKYAELVDYNGYINVHLSADALETVVSQGNIGANAQ